METRRTEAEAMLKDTRENGWIEMKVATRELDLCALAQVCSEVFNGPIIRP